MTDSPRYPLLYLYRTILETYTLVMHSQLSENTRFATFIENSSTRLRGWAQDNQRAGIKSSRPRRLILLSKTYDPLLVFETEEQNARKEHVGNGNQQPIFLPPFDKEVFLTALGRGLEDKSKMAAMMTFYLHADLFSIYFSLHSLHLGSWCRVGKTADVVVETAELLLKQVSGLERYLEVLDVLLSGGGDGDVQP